MGKYCLVIEGQGKTSPLLGNFSPLKGKTSLFSLEMMGKTSLLREISPLLMGKTSLFEASNPVKSRVSAPLKYYLLSIIYKYLIYVCGIRSSRILIYLANRGRQKRSKNYQKKGKKENFFPISYCNIPYNMVI